MLAGSDRSPVGELRTAGITVGLGLDNATLNFGADMVGEMRSALQFDRVAPTGELRLAAADVLAMATIDAARALGLESEIGSIESGKRADLVILDTTGNHWLPRRPADLGIVLQSRIDDIREVLVGGDPVFTTRN
jgi:cytosine/adenosine deaminase-related metal-dependent hydrolase